MKLHTYRSIRLSEESFPNDGIHQYGLLRNSFGPPEEIRAVRTVWRLRDGFVEHDTGNCEFPQSAYPTPLTFLITLLTTRSVRLPNGLSVVR
jgi:hypothetical protein